MDNDLITMIVSLLLGLTLGAIFFATCNEYIRL